MLPPLSCEKLVRMDLKLKPEFEETRVRRRPYPALQEQFEKIERQIQECIDAGLVEEYKKGDYPHHCSPCFLVAKPGSTALRLVVDYGKVNKKNQNHSGSIPNMENTLERIAKCRYKTKMDKRSGFWQVDLTAFWGGQCPSALRRANEQNFVHTEAQASSTGVDFSECRNGGSH